MRIEAHNAFGKPIIAQVTRVVIYDDLDNPIAVALDPGNGMVIAEVLTDPAEDPVRAEEFRRILAAFGITRTVMVKTIQQTPLEKKKFVKEM